MNDSFLHLLITLQMDKCFGLHLMAMERDSPGTPALQGDTELSGFNPPHGSLSRESFAESCPKQDWEAVKGAPQQPSSALAPPSRCRWVMYGAGKEINANTWQSKWLSQKRKHKAAADAGAQHGAAPLWDGHCSAHSSVQLSAAVQGLTNVSWLARAVCQAGLNTSSLHSWVSNVWIT